MRIKLWGVWISLDSELNRIWVFILVIIKLKCCMFLLKIGKVSCNIGLYGNLSLLYLWFKVMVDRYILFKESCVFCW